ncbi:hypothetical protein LZZ85_09500 [Terrimonas sp. NA20]|uniref:Uncharacterized protein n=1 Tax=Terrimonas ginsenosidimutans TaxID=2908004 RepID=A0ABS9KQC2_9BACT|nr:hypothetical protein [Terrimonas ginsenosidimutans]MCG2614516.1 hypothetical protein [Terrimonas ginsenosidimutans]
MTSIKKYFVLCGTCLGLSLGLAAQFNVSSAITIKPPKNRELFHDYIDKEQKDLLAADGKTDNAVTFSTNEEINLLLANAIVRDIDEFQYSIEADSLLEHRLKVNYLTGMSNMLRYVKNNWRTKKVNLLHLPQIIDGYKEGVVADRSGNSIENIIYALPYDAGQAVLAANIFSANKGYTASKNLLILKYCTLHPSSTFITLKDNPDVPFADSLIKVVSKRYPGQLYTYSQASNKLGGIIRNINNDDFVKAVTRMSRSKSGQQYFPFLDNIVKGKITFEELDAAEKDSIQYYRLLVKTQMDYMQRAINKDTAIAFKELTAKLEKKAKDVFVTTINGLHNENDAVRFRCLQTLSAQELFYLAVLSDGLIYTSSYTSGVYPLMMKKINNRGDSLLLSLNFDHYRKFISQAAAYNTLGNFLSTFPRHDDASDLMKAFVGGLEKSSGLEDGVDVADSYASIIETNKKLAGDVLSLVQENYQRNLDNNNKKGIVIYNILNKLFLSADSSRNIDLTKELGIPPVYNVPFSSLTNAKGEVIAQVFFYGDKDGQGIFTGFQNMFGGGNWSIDRSNPQWITIKSVKGSPVVIYANKPLPEETGEDDKAQQALDEYLQKNSLQPTVTIHRGHSYFANSTISYMAPSSRIVFMGSCGGFHLIDSILHKSEDAHIIASKQIGKTAINKPFFQLLTEKLRNGNGIDWIPFWKEFKSKASVEGFEDYIPPYKNLGAIFIKAYRKSMGEEETDG